MPQKIKTFQGFYGEIKDAVALVFDQHLIYHNKVILSVGIDVAEVDRVRRVIEEHGQRFLNRVFTDEEQRYCRRKKIPWGSYAGRFAAKEAGMKALGTGWRGVAWREIGVTRKPGAAPQIEFSGRARDHFERLGAARAHLTLTHTDSMAVAVVILEQ